ncbi:FadR family transcriptional regulator [Caproiciproducens sp. NJN-50]|uniref:FadR/GntR family transcriptional regulator n=1 Tax=Acutalibacteraceae TaxID=3082771 RepID=UPI000FFE26A3|nr:MULTISPECIES: FadR/GntR family transcriptional regulator [Acutalibacteraceae]QAT49331.1 FadR family transcriptional regulator [Caproiciproducens sp. NJN-50]
MCEKPEKSTKAYERVVNYIRHEIWLGNLKCGERLPSERDLAEMLGVSRNSVREAIRTLNLMGFISSVHGVGNFVSCDLEQNLSETLRMMLMMGETNYLQVSQLRRGIESETARLAASRILPRQISKLADLAHRIREEPNAEKGSLLDQEFHTLLCEAAGNKLIYALFMAMITTINNFISTMYGRIVLNEEQAEKLYSAHEELVNALSHHDEKNAIRAIQYHFEIVDAAIERS